MRRMFRVTYDAVSPESAERGDTADSGFLDPAESHFSEPVPMTLREAIRLVGCVYDSGCGFAECDERVDYRNGWTETRTLHGPDNITAASLERLARLLKAA